MDNTSNHGNRSKDIDQHSVDIWEDPMLQFFFENSVTCGEARNMSEKVEDPREHLLWLLEEEEMVNNINLQISYCSDYLARINETSSLPFATLPYKNFNLEEHQFAPPLPPPPPPPPNPKKRVRPCMKQDGKVEAKVDRVGKKETKGAKIEGGEQAIMFIVKSKVDILDDGFSWRKYGEKKIKNKIYPRSYYKCIHEGCKIQKRVERSTENPLEVLINYCGRHIHHPQY